MPADTPVQPAHPADRQQPTSTAEPAERSAGSAGDRGDRSQAQQLKAYLSEVAAREAGDRGQPGPEPDPPPGVRVEHGGGGGGGGGGGVGIINSGESGDQSAGDSGAPDHGGSETGGGGADASGGFITYIGAAIDPVHGSGSGSSDQADSSAPAPTQAAGASLTLSVAIPESATNAGTETAGTDAPNSTSGDDPAPPGQPPDDSSQAAEDPNPSSGEKPEPEYTENQPDTRLAGVISGPKQGTDGQPGHRSEFTGVYQNPDGSEVYSHGTWGTKADGTTFIIVSHQDVTSSPTGEGTGDGEGTSPEGATGSGEADPAPGTIKVEAEVRILNEQTNELETVAEVNETVPPGGHADGDSGKQAAAGAQPEGKAVESTSGNAEPTDTDAEATGTGAKEPEATAEQPAPSTPADHTSAGGSEESFQSFLEGAAYGDYSGNDSWSALAGQTLISFVPGLGQLADARDIAHAIGEVADGEDGAWTDLAINAAAVVPGLDVLKGIGKVGKHADEAVKAAKHLDTAGTGAKHASDAATGAKHADDPTTVSGRTLGSGDDALAKIEAAGKNGVIRDLSVEAVQQLEKKYGPGLADALNKNGTIASYDALAAATKNTGGRFQAHHIVESSVLERLGLPTDKCPAVVLTNEQHDAISRVLRDAIPKDRLAAGQVDSLTKLEILRGYEKAYQGHPEWLKEVSRYFR